MRFIQFISETEELSLANYLSREDLLERERKRFLMILLSSKHRMEISEIASTCSVSENTVRKWFLRYEQEGLAGLLDRPMAHKQSSLAGFADSLILNCVEESPQNLKLSVALLAEKHQIQTNKGILKRCLKKRLDLAESS